jgi:hypothetical protein
MRFSALFASIVLACAIQTVSANAQGTAKGAVAIEKIEIFDDRSGRPSSYSRFTVEAGEIFIFGAKPENQYTVGEFFIFGAKPEDNVDWSYTEINVDWSYTEIKDGLMRVYYFNKSLFLVQQGWVPKKSVQLFDVSYSDEHWSPLSTIKTEKEGYKRIWKRVVVTAARASIVLNSKIKNKTRDMIIERLSQIEAESISVVKEAEANIQREEKKLQEKEAKWQEEKKTWESIVEDNIKKGAFNGDNIIELSEALAAEKGEFESTAVYNEKLKNIATSKNSFMFVKSLNSSQAKYDADKERFTIKINAPIIDIFKTNKKINQHEAQNAYGAKMAIHDEYETIYNIKIINEFKEIDLAGMPIINMSAINAPNYSNNFKLLFIVKIVPHKDESADKYSFYYRSNPYCTSYGNILDATVSDPVRFFQLERSINVELEEIWIYNEFDGQIMKKFPQGRFILFREQIIRIPNEYK